MSTSAVRCPMCGSNDSALMEVVDRDAVWDELERLCRVDLGPEVRERLTSSESLELRRCTACGLDHVEGGAAGDSAFYTAIGAGLNYYEQPAKWEFHQAVQLISGGTRVLDIGCGEGVFIDMASKAGAVPEGLDASEHSRSTVRARGFPCHPPAALHDGSLEPETFGMVTAFQVIEHLEDPVDVVRAAARLLEPGGQLFVSVPNRDRLRTRGLDPFDWPPHHVTRWGRRQLEELLISAGLFDVRSSFERRRARELVVGAVKSMRSGARRSPVLSRGGTGNVERVEHANSAMLTRLLYGHTMLASGRKA